MENLKNLNVCRAFIIMIMVEVLAGRYISKQLAKGVIVEPTGTLDLATWYEYGHVTGHVIWLWRDLHIPGPLIFRGISSQGVTSGMLQDIGDGVVSHMICACALLYVIPLSSPSVECEGFCLIFSDDLFCLFNSSYVMFKLYHRLDSIIQDACARYSSLHRQFG